MLKLQVFAAFICLSFSSFAQQRCYTTEYVNHKLSENPELVEKREAYLNSLNAVPQPKKHKLSADQIVHIPVVFHVVYKTNPQNIDDARLHEQIERLNLDYSATNPDTANVPNEFKPFIADTKIRFHLATTDPDGNATTGITRTETTKYSFSSNADDIKKSDEGGKDAWNTNKYLNIWVGNIESQVLGYAFPPFATGTSFDGVVIRYRNIGNNNGGQFDMGRTATHEVGHYLGLEHLWGGGAGGCSQDDGFSDTPNQFGPNYGINSHPLPSCGSNDMFMNYMDYGNDEMLVMFSKDQRTRMESVIDGVRSDLVMVEPLSVDKETNATFSIFPNPTSGEVILRFDNNFDEGQVSIFDISGREYYSESIGGLQNHNLNVSSLSNGFYFVRVYDGNTTTERKMIVKK